MDRSGRAPAAGTATGQSMLEPAGRGAREVADLWWLMFWISAVIFVLVILLLVFALFVRRPHSGEPGLSSRTRHAFVINGGSVMPFITKFTRTRARTAPVARSWVTSRQTR